MIKFIDFRKAFDLVDPNLLILKLFHYGLENSALNLIKSYFTNRSQRVKVSNCFSDLLCIRLGVPQALWYTK